MIDFLRRFLGAGLFLLAVMGQAQASEGLLKQAYWVDSSGDAAWAEVQVAPFQDFQDTLALGLVGRPVWVRVRIAGKQDAERQVLRIKPSILGRIELFDPVGIPSTALEPLQSGRWIPMGPESYASSALGFVIPASQQDRDVYLRVVSDTVIFVAADVLPMRQAVLEDSQTIFSQALYVGLIVFLAFWALMGFFERQEKIYLLFMLRQLYAAFHALFIFGFGHFYLSRWFSSEFLIFLYDAIILTIAVPGVVFELTLLRELGTSARVGRWVAFILFASVVGSIGLWAADRVLWARLWNQSMGLLLTTFIAYLGFFARVDSDVDKTRRRAMRWLLKTYYVSFFLTLMVPLLAFLDIIKSPSWIVDMIVFHGALSGVMLMVLLALRSRSRELMNQAISIRHEVMTEELVKEKAIRSEKERFLDMLAHEMKNPLTAVNLLLDAKTPNGRQIQRAVDDMNLVIERALQVGRVDDARYQPVMARTQIDQLLKNTRSALGHQDRIVFTSTEPLSLNSDEEMLSIVFGNLLENALKYSPAKSLIQVETTHALRDHVPGIEVRVRNEVGEAGMPDPLQVFQKYYRSPRAHRQVGSGLGLYLVAELLKLLGGRVELSLPLSSSAWVVFIVWLPVQSGTDQNP
jgi:signal transduction histidine kinase